MLQLEFFEIPSPCIGVCEVNNKGFCKGCYRSRGERLRWLELGAEQKRSVIRLCQVRKARVLKARLEALQGQLTDGLEVSQEDLFGDER